jgi:hypothetical protein
MRQEWPCAARPAGAAPHKTYTFGFLTKVPTAELNASTSNSHIPVVFSTFTYLAVSYLPHFSNKDSTKWCASSRLLNFILGFMLIFLRDFFLHETPPEPALCARLTLSKISKRVQARET